MDIFDADHCWCCGLEPPEVVESRTTCCAAAVCRGGDVETFELGWENGAPIGKVEACCNAAAFVVGWQKHVYGVHIPPHSSFTCSHGHTNLKAFCFFPTA